ncbi:OmpA family protein [Flavobacterium sp. J27]|uniref:OmpA family protein n=1 Tax=Flavobacterium sp. J27 TaxID=2060419 RepID=UPI0010312421|nr:OmpA family protein [Flavobacterium sp. J27]
MSKKVLYLLGIVITILIGTWLYTAFCCNRCTVDTLLPEKNKESKKESVQSKKETSSRKSGFSFSSPNTNYYCSENFNFLTSSFTPLLPVSDSVQRGVLHLKEELLKSDAQFKITGLYNSKEENNSIFPNLGLARANAVKNYFVNRGIPEAKIELSDVLQEELKINSDTVFGPVRYSWLSNEYSKENEKDWETIKRNSNANPVILYFNTGQSTIILTQQEKERIAAIVDYVNHVQGAKINITGHSDNDPGVRHTNQYYSEQRAKFAKDYFVANGIPENKIEIYGKGESEPIADNATEVGRAKNRRTEITIK